VVVCIHYRFVVDVMVVDFDDFVDCFFFLKRHEGEPCKSTRVCHRKLLKFRLHLNENQLVQRNHVTAGAVDIVGKFLTDSNNNNNLKCASLSVAKLATLNSMHRAVVV